MPKWKISTCWDLQSRLRLFDCVKLILKSMTEIDYNVKLRVSYNKESGSEY